MTKVKSIAEKIIKKVFVSEENIVSLKSNGNKMVISNFEISTPPYGGGIKPSSQGINDGLKPSFWFRSLEELNASSN